LRTEETFQFADRYGSKLPSARPATHSFNVHSRLSSIKVLLLGHFDPHFTCISRLSSDTESCLSGLLLPAARTTIQAVSELNRTRLATGHQPAIEAASVTAVPAARRGAYWHRHVFASVNRYCAAGDLLLPSAD